MNVEKMRRQLERHTSNSPLFPTPAHVALSQARFMAAMSTASTGLAEFAARMQEHANRVQS